MASTRDLKKKIRSVRNTKKITRTMELVATSKAKRAQDRVNAGTPYSRKLAELLASLARAGTAQHPLLERPQGAARTAILVVTANRSFCGGFNSNVLALAERRRRAELEDKREVDLYVVGRKGAARLRFLKVQPLETWTHFDDRPSFKDAAAIADLLMGRFLAGQIDRFLVASTRYLSAGTQAAQLTTVLPIEPPKAVAGPSGPGKAGEVAPKTPKAPREVEFLYEPDPATILKALLPLSVRTLIYRLLAESAASEQIARRIAMKRATDSAQEMIDKYTRLYNRGRQAGITQQINEIVSGAKALE